MADEKKPDLKAQLEAVTKERDDLAMAYQELKDFLKAKLEKLDFFAHELLREFRISSHIQKDAELERKAIRAFQEANKWPTARD